MDEVAGAILVEVDVLDAVGVSSTLRFADRPIRPFPPTDPDRANIVWDDRLVEPPTFRRAIFDDLPTLSPGLGVGAMVLANADRGLDPWQNHAWGELRVWRWPAGEPFADSILVLRGLSGKPAYDLRGTRAGRVVVSLYDFRAELDRPAQATAYAGTNGTGGVLYEGTADGLKGRPKPLAYGLLTGAQLPAPVVNPGVLAYQLHDGAIDGTVEIRDRGDASGLTNGGNLSGAAFDAATPAAAAYLTDHGRGLLKINGAPVGTVTFGLKGEAGPYVQTAGPIAARLLARAGVPPARIGASVAALAAAAVVGVYVGGSDQAGGLITWVARSALAAVLPDRSGVWQALAFGPPKLIADVEISEDEVIGLESDAAAPEPAGEVRVGWGRIWTTFGRDQLAPALRGTTEETRLASEYRTAVEVDAVVKARFPRHWRTVELTTALRTEADAIALAQSLKTLFGLRPTGEVRRMVRVTLELTPARLAVALGATVRLNLPGLGIDERLILLGEEPFRPTRDRVVWTLWG